MITGDHPGTALRIAIDLGIVTAAAKALTGIELDALAAEGESAFADAIRDTSVFARVAPRHKLQIVRVLQGGG
jgi:P-type Ca2+ transporter type 2C